MTKTEKEVWLHVSDEMRTRKIEDTDKNRYLILKEMDEKIETSDLHDPISRSYYTVLHAELQWLAAIGY